MKLSIQSSRKRLLAASVAVVALPAATVNVDAFVTPMGSARFAFPTTPTFTTAKIPTTLSPTSLVASTMDNPTLVNTNSTTTGASCPFSRKPKSTVSKIEVHAPRTSLDVRIHGIWYDLTGWRKAHPAGDHWIDWYDGRDATEVMDGFHSEKARKMYLRLPKSKPETAERLEATVAPDSPTQFAFRKLFDELEADGWWNRDINHERKIIGIWGGLVGVAALTAKLSPALSVTLLSLSMTAAGWLGHDYIHGIDPFADKLRNFAAVAAGLLPVWWSDKHNKHHALTNEQGCDEDIATDPFLFQWAPSPENDSPIRKIQHWIFYIPFSFLFALWRIDSIKVAISSFRAKRPGSKPGLYSLIVHYAWLFALFPVRIWLPSIFASGLLSALIVTPTHQSEEMFDEYQTDWVTAQFQSTRSAVMTNPFSEWLWGGMQYQLEHHLFPSMPRSKYPALRLVLQKFAKDNKIPGGYRESGEFEILKMNWLLYRDVARADPDPSAPSTRGVIGQQAGILDSANSPAVALAR